MNPELETIFDRQEQANPPTPTVPPVPIIKSAFVKGMWVGLCVAGAVMAFVIMSVVIVLLDDMNMQMLP